MNILGPSTVSLPAAQAWAASIGGHQRYVAVAVWYWKHAPAFGIPPEIAYVQAGHETANGHYTGVVGPERHNWCGLKKKDGGGNFDPDAHAEFPDDEQGVIAHLQHLYRYTGAIRLPDGYTLIDPRWNAVTHFTSQVEGLGGPDSWAPNPNYGKSLVPTINGLRDFAEHGTWGDDMTGDDSRFEWLEEQAGEFGYPQGTRGRNGFSIELAVFHITIGNDSLAYLRGAHGNSAHYLTDKLMRPRAQMIREADAAWTGGNREYNLRGIHLEGEKLRVTDPWTDEMYQNLAETWVPIAKRNSIPFVYLGKDNGPGKRGFIGHSDIPDPDGSGWGGSGNHTDPGDNFDWPRFIAPMKSLDGEPSPPDALVVNGVPIIAGFRAFWEWLGDDERRYKTLGLPVAPEAPVTTVPGVASAQEFERGWLVWQPDQVWDVVVAPRATQRLLEAV